MKNSLLVMALVCLTVLLSCVKKKQVSDDAQSQLTETSQDRPATDGHLPVPNEQSAIDDTLDFNQLIDTLQQ